MKEKIKNIFLIKNADFTGSLEFPVIKNETTLPEKLISFSKCVSSKEYDSWVHFFEDDKAFERLWNSPNRYLNILQKYKGVISPDYSVYRDLPLMIQIWNIYRGRVIASWLQENGIKVIPNVRTGDERTYSISCIGLNNCDTIAVGTHGVMKKKDDKMFFLEGLDYVTKKLNIKRIVVYGSLPNEIVKKYGHSIELIHFQSEFSLSRKGIQ